MAEIHRGRNKVGPGAVNRLKRVRRPTDTNGAGQAPPSHMVAQIEAMEATILYYYHHY